MKGNVAGPCGMLGVPPLQRSPASSPMYGPAQFSVQPHQGFASVTDSIISCVRIWPRLFQLEAEHCELVGMKVVGMPRYLQ